MVGLMYKNFLLYRIELIVIGVLQLFISATVLLTGIAEIGSPEGTLLLYGCMFLIIGFIESGLFAPDEKQSARHKHCNCLQRENLLPTSDPSPVLQ